MKSLRLQEVLQTIQTYFDRQFTGRQFWCQAEVMQIKQHKQRVYIDLVEYDQSGTILAKLKAIVREIDLIHLYIQAHGLSRIDELIGKVIFFEASCGFHAQRGLSLHIQALSHEFARGQLHLQQDKIRAFLLQQGIIENNKAKQIGLPPLRLAVISSMSSEGYRDFLTIIEQSPRKVDIELFVASIHGESAKQQVAEQLALIHKKHTDFSAVVITRGGGGGEGLARQNDQTIAELICRHPLPVILATGHTSDRSLLDEIVRYAAKTPSDAAHLLMDGMGKMSGRLESIGAQIESLIANKSVTYAEQLDRLSTQIASEIEQRYSYYSQTVEAWWSAIQLLAPASQLNRGYALLYDTEGNSLPRQTIAMIDTGDRLMIKVFDRQFTVEVVDG